MVRWRILPGRAAGPGVGARFLFPGVKALNVAAKVLVFHGAGGQL